MTAPEFILARNTGSSCIATEHDSSRVHQLFLHQIKLKNRVRKRKEGLTEVAVDGETVNIIQLAYVAHPVMMELLGVDHFIDALLEEEMRLKV